DPIPESQIGTSRVSTRPSVTGTAGASAAAAGEAATAWGEAPRSGTRPNHAAPTANSINNRIIHRRLIALPRSGSHLAPIGAAALAAHLRKLAPGMGQNFERKIG